MQALSNARTSVSLHFFNAVAFYFLLSKNSYRAFFKENDDFAVFLIGHITVIFHYSS